MFIYFKNIKKYSNTKIFHNIFTATCFFLITVLILPSPFSYSFKPKFKAPNLLKSYVINTCHHSS